MGLGMDSLNFSLPYSLENVSIGMNVKILYIIGLKFLTRNKSK